MAKTASNNCKNNKISDNDILYIENRVFPMSFKVLQISGFWKSTNLSSSKFKSIFYDCYTLFCFASVVVLLGSIIIDNCSSKKSVRDLIENMYLILIIFNCYPKLLTAYLKRAVVIRMLKRFVENRWSGLRDDTEKQILNESIYSERFIARLCIYLVITNDSSNALGPLIHPDPEHDLMADAYSPCDRRRNSTCYWISYVYQAFGYVCTSLIHVGCDLLLYNLMDRTCAHLKLLEHRILQIPKLVATNDFQELDYLKTCVRDHQNICETIQDINETFYVPVFVQFIISISVLCTNIYFLSMQNIFSAEFLGMFLYLCCALMENFCYCWYGYKVLESSLHISDAIFGMNWCGLKTETKQMLSFIMLKTSKKVYLCKNSVATLTPEAFVNIAKLSYSAFNILQQTSKK